MLSWFGGEDDVGILINKKRFRKAARLLRQQLKERPADVHLRQRLADVLALDGDGAGALEVLDQMVDEFAEEGFDAKAIAVLKKMQRIDPDRREVEKKLARLIQRRNLPVWEPVDTESTDEPAMGSKTAAFKAKLPTFQRSPLFATFSPDELLAVIRGLNLLTFEPGEIIVSESEPGSSLFVLANGSVRVYVRNSTWGNQQVRTLEEGAFFGEISLLSGKPRTATITAATPTEILELDRPTLDKVVVDHPHVPEVIKAASKRRAASPEELKARRSGS